MMTRSYGKLLECIIPCLAFIIKIIKQLLKTFYRKSKRAISMFSSMVMNIFKTMDTFTKTRLFLQNHISMGLIAQTAQNGSTNQKIAQNKDIQNPFKGKKFISLLLGHLESTPTIFVIQISIQLKELFFMVKINIMGLVLSLWRINLWKFKLKELKIIIQVQIHIADQKMIFQEFQKLTLIFRIIEKLFMTYMR